MTEEGVKVYLDILPVVEEFQANTLSGISRDDLDTLKSTLDTMIKNAQASI